MTIQQKKELIEILNLRIKRFYNDMNDHWSAADYATDEMCRTEIDRLEGQYKQKYGSVPEYETIDDIFKERKRLVAEVENA